MTIDPKNTAVLTLDIQEGVLGFVPEATTLCLPNAAQAVEAARKAGLPLFHVGLGFEAGYPEIGPASKRFSMLKERGAFLKGSDSATFHPSIYKPGDTIIYKHRVSAFAGNALQMILRAQGIETLVLMGIATSGIVLSTLREAADMDFQCIVLKDACADRDEEVHRVLTEKVFAAQATVMTVKEFQAELL